MAQASQSNGSKGMLRENLLNRLYGDSDYNKIDQNEYNAIDTMDTKKMLAGAHNSYIKNILQKKYGNDSNSQQMIDYQMNRLGQKDYNQAPEIDSDMMPDYTADMKDLSQQGNYKATVQQFVNDQDGINYENPIQYNQNGKVPPKQNGFKGAGIFNILSRILGGN